MQGEIEDWQNNDNNSSIKASAVKSNAAIPSALNSLVKSNLNKTEPVNQKELEALANELDQNFIAANPNSEDQSNEERIQAFTSYCNNLMQTPGLPEEKKNAIQTLLNLRLQGHN